MPTKSTKNYLKPYSGPFDPIAGEKWMREMAQKHKLTAFWHAKEALKCQIIANSMKTNETNLNDVVIPGDTWTSGKILPVPDTEGLSVDQYLIIEKGSESMDIGDYWFDSGQWVNSYGNDIEVSAWRRIPMDGIDAAVAEGDRP